MSNIVIGKSGGKKVTLDLDALLRGRLLIQANSGKGKSWLLRRLAEQLFGKVQVIIIDPEGEFATLREKFGYVLVGKGGETPADPRSAALVAHKLLELRASAVCDLYEMKPFARHEFVQKFIDAMIDAPKNLWHPCVVMVDEAHVYCPEKGAGESVAAEAMIGLGTRGRKRGFCIVPATQRLGKLRKDLAAELVNVMIGGTFIDIDRKRAADALGVYGKDQHAFFDEIKLLERGNFYALGPAISQERILVTVGPVETSHPEAGSARHAAEPPPAPEQIAKMLPKLADLPKAAEEKAKTEAELRSEIRSLKAQIRSAPVQKVQPLATKIDQRAIERAAAPLRQALEDAMKIIVKITAMKEDGGELTDEEVRKMIEAATKEVRRLAKDKLAARDRELVRLKREAARVIALIQRLGSKERISISVTKVSGGEIQTKEPESPTSTHPRPIHAAERAALPQNSFQSNGNLSRSQSAILRAIAEFEGIGRTQISKSWIAARAGASYTSSAFTNNLGYLRTNGYIVYPGADQAALTDKGRDAAGTIDVPTSSEEMLESCLKLLSASQQRILKELYKAHPEPVDKTELAAASGASATSSAYTNNLGALRSAGMIEYPDRGHARCADWMFLD